MRMIPSVPAGDTESRAELKFFKKLAELQNFDDWVCLHSLRLSKSDYNVCGEIDFLLVGPGGVFVCEVKGGRVAFDGKSWIHTNRFGSSSKNDRGPIKQAEQALFSLKKNLEVSSISSIAKTTLFGWFVVFPDIDFAVSSQEWEGPEVLDRNEIATPTSLSVSLQRVVDFWKTKISTIRRGSRALTESEIDAIVTECRPLFDRVPTMKSLVEDAVELSEELTEQQYRLIDLVGSNARFVCEGGAGTGKSFVGLEIARRKRDEGLNVLVTAKNPLLLSFLSRQANTDQIQFIPWEDAQTAGRAWDFVVVDEAQDLILQSTNFGLTSIVRGGLEDGSWLILLDRNSQTGFYGSFSQSAYDHLVKNSTKMKLNVNCRNTANIVSQLQEVIETDYDVRYFAEGPPVLWTPPMRDLKSEAMALENFLSQTLMQYGFSPKDVTILEIDSGQSPVPFLPISLRNLIKRIDFSHFADSPMRKIGLSSVKDFKGMESNVICLVGLRGFASLDEVKNSLYVGMSRSRAMLWIANTPELDAAVKGLIND
jgi:hypothetical protein